MILKLHIWSTCYHNKYELSSPIFIYKRWTSTLTIVQRHIQRGAEDNTLHNFSSFLWAVPAFSFPALMSCIEWIMNKNSVWCCLKIILPRFLLHVKTAIQIWKVVPISTFSEFSIHGTSSEIFDWSNIQNLRAILFNDYVKVNKSFSCGQVLLPQFENAVGIYLSSNTPNNYISMG